MSILEYALSIVTIVLIFQAWYKEKPFNKLLFWLIIDLLLIMTHYIFDVSRWQVYGLYMVPVFIIVYSLLSLIEVEKLKKWSTKLYKLVIGFMILLSILTIVLMPVPTLEGPEGPYIVGTTLLNVQDHDRLEIYGPQTGVRDLRLQIWYPADQAEGEKVSWFIDGDKSLLGFAKANHLPSFALNHFIDVKANSYLNIDISQKEVNYPIVVMSHGWNSSRVIHSNYAEALASYGYIVVGIDHPYAAAMSRKENGDLVEHDASILPDEDFLDEGATMIHVFKEDIEFVIKQLPYLNSAHRILKDKMMLDSLGLLGHSTGAGADVLYALEYEVEAVMGFDPWVEPLMIERRLSTPSLFISSENWHGGPNDINLAKVTTEVYEVKDTMHQDFSMALKMTPLQKWIGWAGDDSSELQVDLIINFFNHTLKRIPLDEEVYNNKRIEHHIIDGH